MGLNVFGKFLFRVAVPARAILFLSFLGHFATNKGHDSNTANYV